MEYYAHKRELPDGKVELQTVSDHLQKTADRAAECLRQSGLSHGAFLAGLLHDMGKFSADYQDYLLRGNGTRGAVIHSFQGCRFLLDLLSFNTKFADENCNGKENYILWQAFATAGRYFTVFDQDTVDVLVPYGRGKELIEALCAQRSLTDPKHREALLKEAGSYTVSLYSYQRNQLEEQHGLSAICGGSAGAGRGVL